jgi:hypothetical protein
MVKFEYYYNNIPGKGLCRNNLIYTSLISSDKKTFCQWYNNDTEYHKGQNQIVDPNLMEEKWSKEVNFLNLMSKNYPEHIPEILDIDYKNKKIFLHIGGIDFWQASDPIKQNYDDVLLGWDKQMLDIIKAHKDLGIYKYSMHPSSYFVVDGKLKSINYFFCYQDNMPLITLKSVLSHISEERQRDLFPKMVQSGIELDKPTSFKDIQLLAFESFKTNFPSDVMEKAKQIYV